MCSTSFQQWRLGIVCVACWWPANVSFDGHVATQFFCFVKNNLPSSIISGQGFVFFLIVQMGHLQDFSSRSGQWLKHWMCVFVVPLPPALMRRWVRTMLFLPSHALLWTMATMFDHAHLAMLMMFAPGQSDICMSNAFHLQELQRFAFCGLLMLMNIMSSFLFAHIFFGVLLPGRS